MKNRLLLSFITLSFLLLASCSIEDLIKEEPDNSTILTSNSPWRFKSFDLAWVTKTDKDTLTDREIELEIADSYKTLAFTFKADGSGITTVPDEEPQTWTWFFDGNNKICFDGICNNGSFTGVKLTENSFSFDLTAGAPSNTEGEQIIYSGRYVFE